METWPETVERVVDGNIGLLDDPKLIENEREDLIRMMTEFKIIPAGRHLWASGVQGATHLMNCWASGWTVNPTDHFEFTFMRLMEGGGVGANYSNVPDYGPISGQYEVHVVCSPEHPDYAEMKAAGLLSNEYCSEWVGSFEVEDSREGWADTVVDLIDTFFRDDVKNKNRVYDVSNVRPAGARLKTFGGTASGPAPLAKALKAISGVLNTRDRLSGMAAMEIDHHLAECVVSGGVRRSARMSMMHWDDPEIFEFVDCKKTGIGHWSTNISVVVDKEFWAAVNCGNETLGTIPAQDQALAVLDAISTGMLNNGEPGFWDISLSQKGEPGVLEVTNPCLTSDATLFTESGVQTFGDLYKSGERLRILTDNRVSYNDDGGPESPEKWVIGEGNGGTYRDASYVFLTQKDAETVVVRTKEGFTLSLTPDHLVATPDGMVAAGDLGEGDKVLVTKGSPGKSIVGQTPKTNVEIEMLLMGLLAGDGTFSAGKSTEKAHICLWTDNFHREEEITSMIDTLFARYAYEPGGSRPYTAYNVSRTDKKITITSSFLARHLKENYGFSRDTKKVVPVQVMETSRNEGLWYLAGLFFCDGTVNLGKSRDSVRLNQSDFEMLAQVQQMLLSNGIYSRIYHRRKAAYRQMPDGKGGHKDYWTKDNYEIVAYGDRSVFGATVGFWNSSKDEKLASITTESYHKEPLATVSSVTPGETQDVYCLKEPVTRSMVANGVAMRRCGEITLEAWEPCNLGHVNLAAFKYDESKYYWNEIDLAHKLMTRFLIRATFADVGDPKSREVLDRNRRIGVGHLGVASYLAMDGERYSEVNEGSFSLDLEDWADVVDYAAERYAHDLRIPVPVKKRTVAPTGTIAKMPGVSEGIHPIFSKYFLRRIRFSTVDADQVAQVDEYKRNGYNVVDDIYADNTVVVEIPTKDILVQAVEDRGFDESVVEGADELTLDQMLAFQALYQYNWADNAVSYTANIKAEDYTQEEIADVIKKYGGHLKGATIFPEASMALSPYERLTKDQYEYSIIQETGDGVDELCATSACPVR